MERLEISQQAFRAVKFHLRQTGEPVGFGLDEKRLGLHIVGREDKQERPFDQFAVNALVLQQKVVGDVAVEHLFPQGRRV